MVAHPVLAVHLRSGQVSRVVYGSIIGLAVVLALEAHPPRLRVTIGTLLATALAVALAELYSELIGARTRSSLGESAEPVRTIVEESAAVGFGVAFPSLFFVAVALDIIGYDTAFTLAKWTGLGLIAGYGFVAARLSGIGIWHALVQASGVALIAAMLIALKALLH